MKCYKKRARAFLLLEILIAFALVALCIFPLVSSQVKILIAEKALQERLSNQRIGNALFVDLVERLYKKEIGLDGGPLALADGFTAIFEIKQEREWDGKFLRVVSVILKKGDETFKYALFCEKDPLVNF